MDRGHANGEWPDDRDRRGRTSDYIDVRAAARRYESARHAHRADDLELTLPSSATYVPHETKDAPTAIEPRDVRRDHHRRRRSTADAMPATLPIPSISRWRIRRRSCRELPGSSRSARAQVNQQHVGGRPTSTTGAPRSPVRACTVRCHTTTYQDRFVVQRWASDFATTQWMSDALSIRSTWSTASRRARYRRRAPFRLSTAIAALRSTAPR